VAGTGTTLKPTCACLALATVVVAPLHAATLYVDASLATGANDGSSWSNAFRGRLGLQAALGVAQSGDEVWTANGTYAPGAAGSPRTVTFSIPEGVKVYGGFAGGESTLSQRDPALHAAVLDGDMAQNGNNAFADNTLHVVTITNCSNATVLDGFSIVNGVATSSIAPNSNNGAGVLILGGSPTVRACILDECTAELLGGGIAMLGSSALIEHCAFRENRAHGGNGLYHADNSTGTVRACRFEGMPPTTGSSAGVGIFSGHILSTTDTSHITVEDCTFAIMPVPNGQFGTGVGIYVWVGQADIRRCDFLNLKTDHGGAGVSGEGTVRIDRCRFIGCEGRFDGGAAIHTFDGAYTVTNSLFAGNDKLGFSTFQSGGPTEVVNCTFYANGAPNAFHTVILAQSATLAMRNCIFWGNLSNTGTQNAVANSGSQNRPRFDDCIVQGWNGALPGTRSFAVDPAFVSPLGTDGIAGTLDDDLWLLNTSPAVDRGNNAWLPASVLLDFQGGPRRQDVPGVADLGLGGAPVVDIGAFETPGSPCDPVDFNGDGLFPDTADINDFLSVFSGGACSTAPVPGCNDVDFNNDGLFPDTTDIDSLLSVFSGGPCL
jgi:hypothetical protein